jgi:hypothetical protein
MCSPRLCWSLTRRSRRFPRSGCLDSDQRQRLRGRGRRERLEQRQQVVVGEEAARAGGCAAVHAADGGGVDAELARDQLGVQGVDRGRLRQVSRRKAELRQVGLGLRRVAGIGIGTAGLDRLRRCRGGADGAYLAHTRAVGWASSSLRGFPLHVVARGTACANPGRVTNGAAPSLRVGAAPCVGRPPRGGPRVSSPGRRPDRAERPKGVRSRAGPDPGAGRPPAEAEAPNPPAEAEAPNPVAEAEALNPVVEADPEAATWRGRSQVGDRWAGPRRPQPAP